MSPYQKKEKLSLNVYSNDMHNGLIAGQSPEFSDTGRQVTGNGPASNVDTKYLNSGNYGSDVRFHHTHL